MTKTIVELNILLFPDRAMSSIYSDPQWSTNMEKAVSRLLEPAVELGEAMDWLTERTKEEYFSLSDIWGVMIAAGIVKQVPEEDYLSRKCLIFHLNNINLKDKWCLWFY